MKKAKKIIERAKSDVAKTKNAVFVADSCVASSKKTMRTERAEIFRQKGAARAKNAPNPENLEPSKKVAATKGVAAEDETVGKLNFPIVGIGVSAGGLEALQDFFKKITEYPNAAFVIIQHLSPEHNSFMGELLRRYTFLPVAFIEEGMRLEANRIYLIPPRVNITIANGVLHHTPIIGHGLNLPIDIFFRSLAEDQKSNAVAIIMSGAGSDGTSGIRAIKEFGGIAMVQDPHDAKFDGMPRSALSTDMIDLVRTATDLAGELVSYLRHPLFTHSGKTQRLTADNPSLFERIIAVLKDAKKVDFSSYRKETIMRRLEKRISINRFGNLQDYLDYLLKTPQEVGTLFHEILIGVTRFFRDAGAFAALEKNCFPAMFKNAQNGEMRIWVASCSTGEEAYSIAILLKEYMLKTHTLIDAKIFATDIDDKSLKFAATGFYPQNVASDIPPQYLAKYFVPHGNGYQVTPDIRSMIIFANQDLIDNPPFFKLDLVTCRNFLIYICPEAQQRVLSSFYVGLKTGGFLFLGPSESLEDLAQGFDAVSQKDKIFKKRDGYTPNYSPKSPMPLHLSMLERPHQGLPNLTQENGELLAILEQVDNFFLQPSLVIDANHNIIYTIRDAGDFLHMGAGRVSTNLLKILPKDLGLMVSSMIRRAAGREEIISSEIVFDKHPMRIRCKHIVPDTSKATYYYICFEKISEKKLVLKAPERKPADLSNRYQERIDDLEAELCRQKENLRVAVEQLETSNEELQSSNEELVASNEELQSSNEELQSVNEELYTVNIEHVRKLEEITELNYDYDNLLSNTQIGTLYLDDKLVVRKISRIAGNLLGIMQDDVGKPLSYFSLRKLYPRFVKDVERVNTTKKMMEKELLLHDKTYCMRIVPYLAEENEFRGVIVTFVDLTDCKMRALQEAYASQEKIRASDTQLEAASTIAKLAYFRMNAKSRKCVGSKLLSELWPMRGGCALELEKWVAPEDAAEVNARVDELRAGKVDRILINFRSAHYGELRYYRLSAASYISADGGRDIGGVIQNITGPIRAQQKIEAQSRLWETSINAIPVLFYAKDVDDDFRYVFANRKFQEFVGLKIEDIVGKNDGELAPSNKTFRDEDKRVLRSKTALSFENEAVLPSGAVRYFHTTKQLYVGTDGRRLIMGVGSDITERRLMMRDMQAANECLSALVESDNLKSALKTVMANLCKHMGATHCFWMSFDNKKTTTRCEYEYVRPGCGKKLFGTSEAMPFSRRDEWYRCYAAGKILDIPDVAKAKNASAILGKYCGFPKKLKAKSLIAIGFRNKGVIDGAVGFVYTSARPQFSPERLSYMMRFAANLFRNALARLRREQTR